MPLKICLLIICHQSHLSGAGHVTTRVNIHRVPESTCLVLATVTNSQISNYFVTNSHWPSDNTDIHTWDTKPYFTICPLFCCHLALVCYQSCDNMQSYKGSGAYQSGICFYYPLTLPEYSLFVNHWSGAGYVTEHINILSSHKILVSMPPDDWFCQKMERLNLIAA